MGRTSAWTLRSTAVTCQARRLVSPSPLWFGHTCVFSCIYVSIVYRYRYTQNRMCICMCICDPESQGPFPPSGKGHRFRAGLGRDPRQCCRFGQVSAAIAIHVAVASDAPGLEKNRQGFWANQRRDPRICGLVFFEPLPLLLRSDHRDSSHSPPTTPGIMCNYIYKDIHIHI